MESVFHVKFRKNDGPLAARSVCAQRTPSRVNVMRSRRPQVLSPGWFILNKSKIVEAPVKVTLTVYLFCCTVDMATIFLLRCGLHLWHVVTLPFSFTVLPALAMGSRTSVSQLLERNDNSLILFYLVYFVFKYVFILTVFFLFGWRTLEFNASPSRPPLFWNQTNTVVFDGHFDTLSCNVILNTLLLFLSPFDESHCGLLPLLPISPQDH